MSTYVMDEVVRTVQIPHGYANSHMNSIIENMKLICKKDKLDVDKAEVKVLKNDRKFMLFDTDTVYFIWNFYGDE